MAWGKKSKKLLISQMLNGLQCHCYLVQCVVVVANYAFLCVMELNIREIKIHVYTKRQT